MVSTLGFYCHGADSIRGWGTEILQALQHSSKKKRPKKKNTKTKRERETKEITELNFKTL